LVCVLRHRVDQRFDEKLRLEERQLEPVGVSPGLVVVGPVEDVVVDDRFVNVAGESVLEIAVGGELCVHPLVDFVEDFFDAIGHVTTQHLVRGSYIHKKRLIFQKNMFLNAWLMNDMRIVIVELVRLI